MITANVLHECFKLDMCRATFEAERAKRGPHVPLVLLLAAEENTTGAATCQCFPASSFTCPSAEAKDAVDAAAALGMTSLVAIVRRADLSLDIVLSEAVVDSDVKAKA